jgi:hypothetical protein
MLRWFPNRSDSEGPHARSRPSSLWSVAGMATRSASHRVAWVNGWHRARPRCAESLGAIAIFETCDVNRVGWDVSREPSLLSMTGSTGNLRGWKAGNAALHATRCRGSGHACGAERSTASQFSTQSSRKLRRAAITFPACEGRTQIRSAHSGKIIQPPLNGENSCPIVSACSRS